MGSCNEARLVQTRIILLTGRVPSYSQEGEEEDEFFTAHNTMVQQSYARQRRGNRGGEGEGTIVEHPSDGTITDLGTLVIIDDDQDEDMDTMKSEWNQSCMFQDLVRSISNKLVTSCRVCPLVLQNIVYSTLSNSVLICSTSVCNNY